jgi:hypothetical protein
MVLADSPLFIFLKLIPPDSGASAYILEARVVAERIHQRVNLYAMQIPIVFRKRFFEFGEGSILFTKRGRDTGNPVWHHIPRLGDVLELFVRVLLLPVAAFIVVNFSS